jgi:hypothetical protein
MEPVGTAAAISGFVDNHIRTQMDSEKLNPTWRQTMEIKDLEISVELADVNGGFSISNSNTQSATNFGPSVYSTQRAGRNSVNSPMTMDVGVYNPQSITQSNSTEQFVDNSGVIDESSKFDLSVRIGGLRRRLVRA